MHIIVTATVKAAVFRNMVGTRVNLFDKAKTNY